MQFLTENRKKSKNPIPVIGLEFQSVSSSEDRCARIPLCAYYKAEARGYESGYELEDWLEADAEVDAEADKSK